MVDEINKLGADLAEIERGIRELSKQPQPNKKRMEFWTREAAKLREEIGQARASKSLRYDCLEYRNVADFGRLR